MGKEWMLRFREVSTKLLLRYAPWMWFFSAIGIVAHKLLLLNEKEPVYGETTLALLDTIQRDEFFVWSLGCLLFSLLTLLATKRNWRVKNIAVLMTWFCAICVFSLYTEYWPWLYSTFDLFYAIDSTMQSNIWDYRRVTWLLFDVFDLQLLLIVSLYATLITFLAPKRSAEKTHAIGSQWKMLWAVPFVMSIFLLVEHENPLFYLEQILMMSDSGFINSEATWLDIIYDQQFVLPQLAAFLVLIWQTRATFTLHDDRFVVGFGEDTDLFWVRWKKVIKTTEIFVGNKLKTVFIEHGLLPFYRFKFGLHAKRDGQLVLDKVIALSPKRETTHIRRGTRPLGYALIILALVSAVYMFYKMNSDMLLIAESSENIVSVFTGADHSILFSALMFISAVGLGAGIGLLTAANYGGLRFLPILAVLVSAIWLPDPLIYWLVYIAIYAILLARIGPVEYIPHIPFVDLEIMEIGLYITSFKVQFALAAYVIAVLLCVKPFYRALPSWPYKFFNKD